MSRRLDKARKELHHERAERNGTAAKPGPLSASSPSTPVAVVRTMADVAALPVAWLWKPWIPLGALTLLDGDPDLGKSTLTLDIAARVSRGWGMPLAGAAGGAEPAGVLLLSAEDDPARTIRPRLDAAGADVRRVHTLEGVKRGDDEQPPVLPWDLALMEGLIAAKGVKLVVVDPFMAFLDGQVDAHRDQDVRRCLHRLKLLAERFGVAVVLVRHLNKMVGGPALYRGGGSIGIVGAVRSALVVGRNPADPHQRVLASVKCNLAAAPRSLLYTLEPVGNVARIGWAGETDLGAADILGHAGGGKRQSNGEQCAEAIRELLAAGPRDSKALDAELDGRGFSERAVKEGRKLAGVQARREGFSAAGRWMVSLASDADADDAAGRNPYREELP